MTVDMQFRAMGSDAHVIVVGGSDDLAEVAYHRIEELEARWSRFVDSSEICAINRAAGHWVEVSDDTTRLVELAIEGWRLTGGGFDPTVLGAVVRAGYDRTFSDLANSTVPEPGAPGGASRRRAGVEPAPGGASRRRAGVELHQGPTSIELGDRRVRLPRGAAIDAGGIGKGLAADMVAAELMALGAQGACVNLGGDLRVEGNAADGGDWTIAVADPWSTESIVDVAVRSGAVATSSTARRRWMVGGDTRHHLIDPTTGEPSTTDLVALTVIAGNGWLAEVFAKGALLRGSTRCFDILPAGIEALAVTDDGDVLTTPGFANFTSYSTSPLRSTR